MIFKGFLFKNVTSFLLVFRTIAEEDMSFFEGDIREFSYPDFGKSDSSVEVWQEFYAFFTAYVTTRYLLTPAN